jgi:hypothetical protein
MHPTTTRQAGLLVRAPKREWQMPPEEVDSLRLPRQRACSALGSLLVHVFRSNTARPGRCESAGPLVSVIPFLSFAVRDDLVVIVRPGLALSDFAKERSAHALET